MRSSDTKFNAIRLLISLFILTVPAFSQAGQNPQKSQEISDEEEIPVLIKHLPAWETKTRNALFFSEDEQFRAFFRSRKIIESVDFFPGTEAVFAEYPEGALLIVEYSTPQASSEIDKAIIARDGTASDSYIYRRIGNYNVFLFDPTDIAAGNLLMGQIEYQKVVTWPYGNPKPFFERERAFILEASSLFISTVMFILTGIAIAIFLGAVAGFVYFQANTRRRASMAAFSDAGGLTRLNLDGFTPDLTSDKLLED